MFVVPPFEMDTSMLRTLRNFSNIKTHKKMLNESF